MLKRMKLFTSRSHKALTSIAGVNLIVKLLWFTKSTKHNDSEILRDRNNGETTENSVHH